MLILLTGGLGFIGSAVIRRLISTTDHVVVNRLARDYERLPETGETMIHAAMSRIILRRITV